MSSISSVPIARIAVIDDDREVNDLIANYLRASNFDVVQAYDVEGGLDAIRETRPSVAFVDMRLHGQSGYSILTRAAAEGLRPPAVLMSGDTSGMPDAKGALEPDVRGILRKPFRIRELPDLLAGILSSR